MHDNLGVGPLLVNLKDSKRKEWEFLFIFFAFYAVLFQ